MQSPSATLREEFPDIAELVAPPLRDCAVEDVETLLRQQFGVESIESFGRAFSRLKRGARSVSRVVPRAMPAVGVIARTAAPLLPVAGQVAGAMIGGPAGAMVGGAVGGMAGRAVGGGPRRAPRGRRLVAGLAAAPLGAVPASAQLINILGRPEVLKALTSMALGPAGNPHTNVGGTNVPVAAIANLIGSLAQQAAEQYRVETNGEGEELPEYLSDAEGGTWCDVSSSDERAAVTYGLLTASDAITWESLNRTPIEYADYESPDNWESAAVWDHDDMDLGELWAEEAFE